MSISKIKEILLLEKIRYLFYIYLDREIPYKVKEKWLIKITKVLDKI